MEIASSERWRQSTSSAPPTISCKCCPQVITSLPNTNIADAVGRLPSVSLERDEGEGKYVQIRGTEPRLSNLTINGVNVPSPEGNVRNIKMDIIPSGIVEFIEVNKTLSANQDGDAIGGSVNLVTKTARERPTLDIEGQGGYTNIIGGRWLDAFNSTWDSGSATRKQWGFLLGGTYDWNGRGINDLEPAPGDNDSDGQQLSLFCQCGLANLQIPSQPLRLRPRSGLRHKAWLECLFQGTLFGLPRFRRNLCVHPQRREHSQAVNGSQYTFYTPRTARSAGLTSNKAPCSIVNTSAALISRYTAD